MGLLFNHALIKLQDLKDYLVVQGNASDQQLESAINAATITIEQEVGRELVSRGDSTITEYHTVGWPDRFYELYVSEWPIVSVTTLHEDDSWPRAYAAGSLLTLGTDFEISPREGFIRRLGSGGPMFWKSGTRIVKLVYKAGYQAQDVTPTTATVIPEDLKLACRFVAASIFKESDRQRWGVSAVTDAVGTVTRFLGYFTPEMKNILGRYRRMEHHRTWERAA